MADYRFDGRVLYDKLGRRVGVLNGTNIYNPVGNIIGNIHGKTIREASGGKIADFDGRNVRDSFGKIIATDTSVKRDIKGIGGVSLVAMWVFFVR